jgi:hypothetical protein
MSPFGPQVNRRSEQVPKSDQSSLLAHFGRTYLTSSCPLSGGLRPRLLCGVAAVHDAERIAFYACHHPNASAVTVTFLETFKQNGEHGCAEQSWLQHSKKLTKHHAAQDMSETIWKSFEVGACSVRAHRAAIFCNLSKLPAGTATSRALKDAALR